MRRMLGVLRDEPRVAGDQLARGNGTSVPPLAPQPGLGELDALVERVRGTGLDVVGIEHTGGPSRSPVRRGSPSTASCRRR